MNQKLKSSHAGDMDVIHSKKKPFQYLSCQSKFPPFDLIQSRLRRWQQVRSWARLIREVENLWHVEEKEVKRLGAFELSHLLDEVPLPLRPRVNRWLDNYASATRLNWKLTKLVNINSRYRLSGNK